MSGFSDDQLDIVQEYITENRDLLEQLEPTIIQLGQNCKGIECWETMDYPGQTSPPHERALNLPCWIDSGFIKNGSGECSQAQDAQGCLNCPVFMEINGDPETINAVFRLFHTIKGTSAFLKFEHVNRTSHAAESLLDLIRIGEVQMMAPHIDLLCQACDFIKDSMDNIENELNDHAMEGRAEEIALKLEQEIGEALRLFAKEPPAIKKVSPVKAPEPAAQVTMPDLIEIDEENPITPEMARVFLQEADELLQTIEQDLLRWSASPKDPEIISQLFRNIHSFKGNCGIFSYAHPEKLSHQIETVLQAVKDGARLEPEKLVKILLSLKDVLRNSVGDISQGGVGDIKNLDLYLEILQDLIPEGWVAPEPRGEVLPLGQILVEEGVVDEEEVNEALEDQQQTIGEKLVDRGYATSQDVQRALEKQEELKTQAGGKGLPIDSKAASKPALIKRQDIRVDLEKLDSLINLIGELVIAENMVVNNPDLDGLELESFGKASQQMGKLVRELQELAMTIRMIPVSGIFRRMIRLVHDLSGKSGKKVDLRLSGEETEVDKTMIELITDPLVHLIRNALDHGLEGPEERVKAQKPEKGTVKLSARHEEGEIWITIEDDGRGMDREKIISKAQTMGLINGDSASMSDKEVYDLVFQPGFSTAEKVTDVSGRGVGMDVVKKNLEKMRGKIDVLSKLGQGTKLILRIPLTLAIIDGMMIRVGGSTFIIPILNIKQSFRPEASSITHSPDGQEIVRLRDEFYPVVRLHELHNITPDNLGLSEGILVIVEAHQKKICLFVDEIVGQQQTVIKGLSDLVSSSGSISGCTILGNGNVCLILDSGSLVEISAKQSDGDVMVKKHRQPEIVLD